MVAEAIVGIEGRIMSAANASLKTGAGHEGSFVGTIFQTFKRRFRAASGHPIRDDECRFIGRSIS